jgi:acyl carrier protein
MMYDERIPVQNVRDVMAEVFDVDEADIPDDASPENFPKWTSLEHLTLLVALEARFGTSFSINEMGSMTSLPQIVAVLGQHKVAQVS